MSALPPEPHTEAWKVAVRVRPHYPPCDFPDHACECGAAEDRPKIVQAFAEVEARVQAAGEALARVEALLYPGRISSIRQGELRAAIAAPVAQAGEGR